MKNVFKLLPLLMLVELLDLLVRKRLCKRKIYKEKKKKNNSAAFSPLLKNRVQSFENNFLN
jgi:hypothetical protein